MTATALLDELRTRGVHLTIEGEHVAVDAPKGALTDALRQAIRAHKPDLLRLLAQTTSAHESPLAEVPVLRPSAVLGPSSQHIEDLETCALTWRFWERPGACHACGTTRRWRSIYNVVVCVRCHPPADTALVAWEGLDMEKTIDTKEGDV